MNHYNEQKKEIETIKDRTITLKLSDADCERISIKAGKHGLTVGELLANFIGDLVNGTYSNGSDERDRAEHWFERCWFGMFPEETLLWYMLNWGHDVDNFLTAVDELEYYQENSEEFKEETEGLCGEKLWFEDDIEEVTKPYIEKHPDADIKKEIELCRKWFKDLKEIKGDSE